MTEHLEKRALERRLRDRGASRAQSVAAVARAWRYRWVGRLSPRVFAWLAMREVRRV